MVRRWKDGSLSRGRLLVGRHCRQLLLGPADVGSQILQSQLELIAIEPFGPPAELQALQLLDDNRRRSISTCAAESALRSPVRSAASCRIS